MKKKDLLLSRFFSTGPSIVIAFDHGLFVGPFEGFDKVEDIPKKILPEVDGVLMSPGMLSNIGLQICGHRNSPIPIVRINWSTIFCSNWNYHSGDTVKVLSPQEALLMGAQMVLISLSLQTGDQKRDAENIDLLGELCTHAHQLGMPVIAEYFPVDSEKLDEEQLHNEIKIGCRILYEMGADAIKTFYSKNFEQIVAGCPTPILALGGERLASDLDALKYARQQIQSGASGIVFGRNVMQSEKPIELQKALIEVVKQNVNPEEAAAKYGLK